MAVLYKKKASDSTAIPAIDLFQKNVKGTVLAGNGGVAYRVSDINRYFENDFLPITQKHEAKMGGRPAGMEWGLAHVWKYGNGANNKQGLGFFIVPVLIDSAGKVLNYFDPANDGYYDHSGDNLSDEGHLFP
ncbi:MAG: hypothetical protein EOP50_03440 [Sphingobacteriales bacterium]|nr:MAG: hypothetical protein EOP50_03440 [Sphingobacteriales bacterium]